MSKSSPFSVRGRRALLLMRDEREIGMHAVIQHLPPKFANVEFRTRAEGDTFKAISKLVK